MKDVGVLLHRIQEYLECGGFINPEMMDHNKVRDLLISVRNYLAADLMIISDKSLSQIYKEAYEKRRKWCWDDESNWPPGLGGDPICDWATAQCEEYAARAVAWETLRRYQEGPRR